MIRFRLTHTQKGIIDTELESVIEALDGLGYFDLNPEGS